jgi:hypothetical protein
MHAHSPLRCGARLQRATIATASLTQRSISTKTTSRFVSRSGSTPSSRRPRSAMRTPSTWPAHRCPCRSSASRNRVSISCMVCSCLAKKSVAGLPRGEGRRRAHNAAPGGFSFPNTRRQGRFHPYPRLPTHRRQPPEIRSGSGPLSHGREALGSRAWRNAHTHTRTCAV